MENPYEAPQSQLNSAIEQKTSGSSFESVTAVSLLISEILLIYFGFLTYPAMMWTALALSSAGFLMGLKQKRPWILMIEFVMIIIASLGLYLGTQLFILSRPEVLDSLKVNAPSPR